MKMKNFIVYNIIFVAFMLFAADVVMYQLTGDHLVKFGSTATVHSESVKCTDTPVATRAPINDPQLKAVPEYEAACGSAFIDDMMLFTNMPVSADDAKKAADAMTVRLQNFKSYGINPIVIAEPDSEWGLIDFHEFATGFYDSFIDTYFARLKQNNIDDASLGTWVPFPEPQQDYWNNASNPDDFANSVNRYFKILRTHFPQGKTAILLDSQTAGSDVAPQLLAYTRLIDNSLVNIAGVQGFPWHPKSNSDKRPAVTSASIFAPASLADEVAKSIGTKEVLLNIGSYRHRKLDNGGTLAVTTTERQQTLSSITAEVKTLRSKGYSVTVNIFAENKFDVKEGVDWSYWPSGQYGTSPHTALFTNFVHDLHQSGAKIGIFDVRS